MTETKYNYDRFDPREFDLANLPGLRMLRKHGDAGECKLIGC